MHVAGVDRPEEARGRVALITGASSGVGRAIASALSQNYGELCLAGRDAARLEETASGARRWSHVTTFQLDLTVDKCVESLAQNLGEQFGRVDALIHCSGIFQMSTLVGARIEDLDLQYASNFRAPYVLTKRLLPLLETAEGQVVFMNSSAGLNAKRAEIAQYAATKHALRAFADSLREEVNPKGIRVLSVYLGRTATPMQEAIYRQEGKVYRPERLLDPADVAAVVQQALMLPRTAEITEISIRPMLKS
jgi:NADP-dependent 3-hydroxy acid dehydrogenase YdfG